LKNEALLDWRWFCFYHANQAIAKPYFAPHNRTTTSWGD
jgi:hypothetical protein